MFACRVNSANSYRVRPPLSPIDEFASAIAPFGYTARLESQTRNDTASREKLGFDKTWKRPEVGAFSAGAEHERHRRGSLVIRSMPPHGARIVLPLYDGSEYDMV
jgi:hypothetical protein